MEMYTSEKVHSAILWGGKTSRFLLDKKEEICCVLLGYATYTLHLGLGRMNICEPVGKGVGSDEEGHMGINGDRRRLWAMSAGCYWLNSTPPKCICWSLNLTMWL